jgi:hypothetical protein
MTKPFTVSTLSSAASESLAAVETAEQLRSRVGAAQVRGAILYGTVGYDIARLQAELRAQLPGIPFLGATECLGVGSSGGGFTRGRALAGLFLLGDGFRFGVASAQKGGDPHQLGEQLAARALEQAGIPAAKARFAIIHPTPGDEESILAGAYGRLDHQTAIIGGSAADDDLSGRWHVWTHDFVSQNGAALAVCDWPWKLAINYQSGYLPTTRRGKVTRAEGRTLLEIDGRPAAEVYNSWLGGELKPFLEKGGNVLASTTMKPLGVTRGLFGGIQAYVLAHPERVLAEQKALTLFTRIKEGEEVVMMSSSPEALIARSANVARLALSRAGLKPEQIVGGLLVYCGGCVLAIRDQMPQMLTDFEKVLAGAPYVGHFAFGEQGCVLPRQVDHGNLMANVLLLSAE